MDDDHYAYSCKFVTLSLREFCGAGCSTVMHGTAFQATDAPILYIKNN